MSDPLLDVDADTRDAVVAETESETWLVKPSDHRWQVWRDHNRRRPPSRAERRGRVAAATAGTIIGVLGVGGALTYAVQWQNLTTRADAELGAANPYETQAHEIAANPVGSLRSIVDFQGQQAGAKEGWIAVVDGKVVAFTPNASGAAADKGLISKVDGAVTRGSSTGRDSYLAPSKACAYQVTLIHGNGGENASLVRLVDLTAPVDAMNRGYLTYGLIGLGAAGASAGAVWIRLGRQLNQKVEPEDV